jgi:hydroxymethylpyrimidine/phosphomethylpyrimidine kinase
MTPVALTIAGSDPSGGAGIQADLKTFHQHGVYGESVVTLLTVQNTRTVAGIEFVAPVFVGAQIDAVVSDIPPHAAKTGALGRADIIEAVAERARAFRFPLVVDPVMVSKHGLPLLADDAVDALVGRLLPHAALVTPNLPEAARLTGLPVEDAAGMERAARAIHAMGARAVLVKGGHLAESAMDLLLADGRVTVFPGERIESTHTAPAARLRLRSPRGSPAAIRLSRPSRAPAASCARRSRPRRGSAVDAGPSTILHRSRRLSTNRDHFGR